MTMKRKTIGRLISLILAVFMIFNIMPAQLLADETKSSNIWIEELWETQEREGEISEFSDGTEEEQESEDTEEFYNHEEVEEDIEELLGEDASGFFGVENIMEDITIAPASGGISPTAISVPWSVSGDITGNYATLSLAFAAVNADGGNNYIISALGGNETLTEPLTVDAGKNVYLEATGGIVDIDALTATGYLFRVNGTLTVENIAIEAAVDIGGVQVNSTGHFIMEGNSSIKNAVSFRGVYVNGGTFTMNSGEISGNAASTGAGVYITGASAVFNLNGGTIKDNRADTNGGGVYVASGAAINMSSGSIEENRAENSGGGIFIANSGNLNMTDGFIKNNYANVGGGITGITAKIYIEKGEVSNNNALNTYGGGLYITNSELQLVDSHIIENVSAGGGGGVYSAGSTGTITMEGGEISRNKVVSTATGRYGGGVYINQGTFEMSNGEVNNNSVEGNTTVYGGGFYLVNNAGVSIYNSDIKGNSALRGGGFYLASGTFKIYNSEVTDNNSGGSGGGGCLAANDVNELIVEDSKISNNGAETHGAAIYQLGGKFTAENSEFDYNVSGTSGGAVYVSAGIMDLSNCSLNFNKGNGGGGALYIGADCRGSITDGSKVNENRSENTSGGAIYVAGGVFKLKDSEVNSNYSGITGGGIYSTGDFDMDNTTVKDNESKAYGGGISVPDGKFIMTNSKIMDNRAGTLGGGVYAVGEMQIFYSLISGNNAGSYGGGFAGVSGASNRIEYSEIRDNEAGRDGGGIYLSGVCCTIVETEISGNSAFNAYGGGIYINEGRADIENSRILSNSCKDSGGGAYLTNNGIMLMRGGSIEENIAEVHGGGIYVDDTSTIDLGSLTAIRGNKGLIGDGGGIYTENTLDYNNLIIDAGVLFTGNTARASCLPPADALLLYPAIQTCSASEGFGHPLNNFDINYWMEYMLQYDLNGGNASGPADEIGLVAQYGYTLNTTDIPVHPGDGISDVVFIGWAENWDNTIYDEGDSLDGIITAVDILGDTTVYAVWGYDRNGNGIADILEDKYILTIECEIGGAIISGDSGFYKEDDLIFIEAAPGNGYRFIEWITSSGGIFGDALIKGTTFLMPAEDVTVTARFEKIEDDKSGGDDKSNGDKGSDGGNEPDGNGDKGSDNSGSSGGYVTAATKSTAKVNDTQEVFATLITDDHFAYIYGYEDGTVRVDNAITRGEAAAIFYRLLSVKGTADHKIFSDIAGDEWYAQAVNYLGSINVINGYPDGSFKPHEFITRGEFATLSAGFDKLELAEVNRFADVAENHWAVRYINSAYLKGWVNGYPDGTFKSENNITRGEVVTIVNGILDREIDRETLKKVSNPYSDITAEHWAYGDIIEASFNHEFIKEEEELWTSW